MNASSSINGDIELLAHGGPRSGPYRMLQALAASITELDADIGVTVSALPGEEGGEAMKYVASRTGDPRLAASCTPSYFTTPLKREYDFTYRVLTPLCGLVTDTYVLVVAADDPAPDVRALLAEPLVMAAAPKGGNTQIQATLLSDLGAVSVTTPFYAVLPDALTAVASGEARATTCVASDVAVHPRSSELRILGALAAEQDTSVPTLTSQGVPLVFPLWRGLVGPPHLDRNTVQAWTELISQAIEQQAWKRFIEESAMRTSFLDASSFDALLKEEGPRYEEWSRLLAAAA